MCVCVWVGGWVGVRGWVWLCVCVCLSVPSRSPSGGSRMASRMVPAAKSAGLKLESSCFFDFGLCLCLCREGSRCIDAMAMSVTDAMAMSVT